MPKNDFESTIFWFDAQLDQKYWTVSTKYVSSRYNVNNNLKEPHKCNQIDSNLEYEVSLEI